MFNYAVRRRLLDANTLRGGYDTVLGEVVAVDTHQALGGSRDVGIVGAGQAIG